MRLMVLLVSLMSGPSYAAWCYNSVQSRCELSSDDEQKALNSATEKPNCVKKNLAHPDATVIMCRSYRPGETGMTTICAKSEEDCLSAARKWKGGVP